MITMFGGTGFKIVPPFLPKKGFKASSLAAQMNYPLSLFSVHEDRWRQGIYRCCLRDLVRQLGEWKEFKAPRSRIEEWHATLAGAILRDINEEWITGKR